MFGLVDNGGRGWLLLAREAELEGEGGGMFSRQYFYILPGQAPPYFTQLRLAQYFA